MGDDALCFEDYLHGYRLTYKELYDELTRSINGLGGTPSFRVRGILRYLSPPQAFEKIVVKQHSQPSAIADSLVVFRDHVKTYFENKKKDPSLVAPVFASVLVSSTRTVEEEVNKKAIIPVHGPYDAGDYLDKKFAIAYDLRVHDQRVSDIFEILFGVSGNILALGDGAGTCYEACLRLRAMGHAINCRSFDYSDQMIELALERGNIVNKGDFFVPVIPGEILFLSHVCDYYPPDFLALRADCPIISFERVTTFPGCHWLKPYKKEWGYAIATRNYHLENIILSCVMQVVPPLDFTVVSVAQELFVKHVTVYYDVPEYITLIDTVNDQLQSCPAHAKATDEAFISCRVQKTSCQGIPHFGVVTNQTASRLGNLTQDKVLEFFKSFGGVFVNYSRYVPRVFAVTVDAVFSASNGLHHQLHTSLRGDFRICRVPKNINAIVVRGCLCHGSTPHDHALLVAFKSTVIIQNINYDIMLKGFSPTTTAQRLYVSQNYCGPGDAEQYYNNLACSAKTYNKYMLAF